MDSLLRGLLLGFSIAAPVGPVGLLVIRRTLAQGRLHGLLSGLGAASADAAYGLIAALGLTALTSALVAIRTPMRIGGGLFLIYLGVTIARSMPAEEAAETKGGEGLGAAYLSTLLLTLTNPATILSFIGVIAGLGPLEGGLLAPLLLVLGVFCGSALWWLILSGGVSLFRGWMDAGRMVWVNRLSGVMIGGLGLWVLVELVMEILGGG